MSQYVGVDPSTGYDTFTSDPTIVTGHRPLSILDALFPRLTATEADPTTYSGLAQYVAKGGADASSIPGRLLSALAAPDSEDYLHAVARTKPAPGRGLAASVAEGVARDPLTLAAPAVGFGLSEAAPVIRGLAQAGLSVGNDIAEDRPISSTSAALAGAGDAIPVASGLASSFSQPANRVPGEYSGWAFKRWFGDSPLIGSDGNPIQLYHGTANPNIDKLLPSADGVYGPGIYLASSPSVASKYAELASKSKYSGGTPSPNVIPVYASPQNPFNLNRPVNWDRVRGAFATPEEMNLVHSMMESYPNMPAANFYEAMTDLLSKELDKGSVDVLGSYTQGDAARSMAERLNWAGYDAMQYPAHEKIIVPGKGYEPQSDNFVIWDPEDVKGVYNSGEWATGGGLMHLNGEGGRSPNITGKVYGTAMDSLLTRGRLDK